jgi:demethylmenaquinone methyltransferase/2-methoxy-6-polyprenyl-1,4-benzoquinol methylase
LTAPSAKPSRDSGRFGAEVNGMFDRVAARYDLLNAVMTAGLHHGWSERAAERAGLAAGESALDVCCGTGDLALGLASRVGAVGTVVGCDFSEPMLELARGKAAARGLANARFDWADALDLPFEDGRFDAVTVGYGVRNFADRERGLRELARVLRKGGRLVVLEFTQPRRQPFSSFYALWFDRIVPLLGRLSSNPRAYSYLAESVRGFPDPQGLAAELDAAGLSQIRCTVLAGGIVTIHSGIRTR